MTCLAPATEAGTATRSLFGGRIVALYAGTLLLAACLLFSLQPMFTKRVLPLLGGAPAVWSIAMVVFQGLMLAGYAYAHVIVRRLPHRTGVVVHLVVLAGGFIFLPIAVAQGFGAPPDHAEALWLVGLFLASIGLPFFALSATAPLLQAWFARSGDDRAHDPYFLYRASNAGSFAALLAYPLAIEPMIGLDGQARAWSFGYVALACAILACGLAIRGGHRGPSAPSRTEASAIGAGRRLAWIGLSAVPSGLLVAATAHISTDVAAIPLIWVLPLALYLLSFIATFRTAPRWPERWLGGLQVGLTALALPAIAFKSNAFALDLVLTLGLLFLNALIAHRAAYTLRPAAARLTDFYLCTSLGGVIGGIFAALVAPQIFSGIHEYPILLIASLACRPEAFRGGWRTVMAVAGRSVLIVCAIALLSGLLAATLGGTLWIGILLGGLLFVFVVNWRDSRRSLAYGAGLGLVGLLLPALALKDGESHRSFFGVHRIDTTEDGRFRMIWHGTTLHGAMRIREDDGSASRGRPEPTTYYAPGNPLAEVLEIGRRVQGSLPAVSVVGLGAGSLACHAAPGEAWAFYEIDPVVIRIATDRARFRFLSDCTPDAPIVQGDARLTLAKRSGAARALILDAFSSDAIPMHLLTGEALDIALAHLDAEGLLAFHISNRQFELKNVLARLAADRGLTLLMRADKPSEPFERRMRAPSAVVMMSRDPAIERDAISNGWTIVAPDLARRPWSDDYANAFEALFDRLHPAPAP